MDNYATLRCVLKVHPRCDSCKRHTMDIIGSITGTYDITMDAEKSQATIVGQVDPNFCLKAITRCNGHAEIVWANLSHPRARGQSYGYGGYRDSYHPLDYPTRSLPHYSYTPNNINYDYNYDRRRRTDPYGVDTIPYYNEESMNHCIIL
ncbi:uncharacterized protein LOC121768230 [Salvia splendens]|uniref:uncharacterized protein LOC121768230 n=1 Tax=Salvia splendens TaxID=180675 RepID=UPI001C2553A2|nr:uncharacterized protein LOC121768230 [Salvia splendens]